MLTGEAKTAYQREYMRRKRAGLPTAKPKPEWQPSQRMIDQIAFWYRRQHNKPWQLRGPWHKVIDGLKLENGDEAQWMEACRRLKAYQDDLRAEAKARKEEASKPKVHHCSFCRKPASPRRALFGDRWAFICQPCATKAAKRLANVRQRARR